MDQVVHRILVVDDDEEDFLLTQDMLLDIDRQRYQVEWHGAPDSALERILSSDHDLVLLDYHLGKLRGLDILREAIGRSYERPIILLTGQGDQVIDAEAMKSGASDYLIKGQIDSGTLERSIRYAIKNKETEMRLKRMEQTQRRLLDSLPVGIALISSQEDILYMNPKGSSIFGYERDQILGMNLQPLVTPSSWNLILEQTEKRMAGQSSTYECEVITSEGATRTILISGSPFVDDGEVSATIGGFTDITEKKNIEREKEELRAKLVRAQRLESFGILAGGVAHDLNNILGPLVGYPDLILGKLSIDDPIREKIVKIKNSAETAASVVQDLLCLARRGRYEMTPVDLNTVLDGYFASAELDQLKLRYPHVSFEKRRTADSALINGSSCHLHKIVMNLVQNAAEAIAEAGTVVVSVEGRYMDQLETGFDNINAGYYHILRVSDTGEGIAEQDMKKIFEPFFSKKQMGGSGSGLGLAIVYSTVKDHNGYIDIVSTLGKGTTFILYFPKRESATNFDSVGEIVDIHGTEEILVVDDVPEQRELCSTILGSLGYRVNVAANGHEAIAFMSRGGVADVVVLDMVMEPGFDGLDTYKAILRLNPNQRVIIASGYAETDRVKEAMRLGIKRLVTKPYTLNQLAMAIRATIASPFGPDDISSESLPQPSKRESKPSLLLD